jgi:hypothetical protein
MKIQFYYPPGVAPPKDPIATQCQDLIDNMYTSRYGIPAHNQLRTTLVKWLEDEIPCKIETGGGGEDNVFIKSIELEEKDYTMFVLKYSK